MPWPAVWPAMAGPGETFKSIKKTIVIKPTDVDFYETNQNVRLNMHRKEVPSYDNCVQNMK